MATKKVLATRLGALIRGTGKNLPFFHLEPPKGSRFKKQTLRVLKKEADWGLELEYKDTWGKSRKDTVWYYSRREVIETLKQDFQSNVDAGWSIWIYRSPQKTQKLFG